MLLLVIGPPAVGKMTVARAVAASSGFRLFHNHMTIDPLVETFGYGTAPFRVLNGEFRRRVLEEAARHGVDLVFSLVVDLDDPEDVAIAEGYAAIFDGDMAVVELRADLATRLERNRGEERLLHKPTKRDLAWSDANVRDMERYAMTTENGPGAAAGMLARYPHLVVDTVARTPQECAAEVLAWLRSRG